MKKKNNIDILFDYNRPLVFIKEITKNKKIKSEELRNSVLVLLKDVILKSKKESEKKLFDHGSGTQCARSFSIFQDEIIKIIRKYRPDIILTNAPSDRHMVF